jgi:outer membrane biosynthesis protein TonB
MQRRTLVLLSFVLSLALAGGMLACKKKATEEPPPPSPTEDVAPLPPPPLPAEDVAPLPPPPPPAPDVVEPPPAADVAPAPADVEPAPADAAPPPADGTEPPPAADAATEPPPPEGDAGAATAVVEPPPPPVIEGDFPTMMTAVGDLAVVEAHLCTAVENRQCTGEGRVFTPEQMVWILLKVTNATTTERQLRVSYVREGDTAPAGRGVALRIPGQPRYATFAKGAKGDPGRYDVVVRDEQENVLARLTYEVR